MKEDIKLTQDQILAKMRILAFIKNKGIKEKYFTLSGKGGTGKTFVIGKALDDVIKSNIGINRENIICATISHSAKNVLYESIEEKYNVVTVASLLNMQIDYGENGELLFVPPSETLKAPISEPQIKIIIIDECSMISEELFGLIMSMKRDSTKVIAMGDHCQLPPVGDPGGSPFLKHIGSDLSKDIFDSNNEKINLYSELTEILRYKGPVVQLGDKIREQVELCIADEVYDKHIINRYTGRKNNIVNGSGYNFYNSPSILIQDAALDFAAHKEDPMHCVVLAYKNKTVNILNTLIRRQIYGEDLPKFVEGELVICNGGYNFGNSKSRAKIHNGEVFIVKEIFYEERGPHNIPSIILRFKDKDFQQEVYVVDPDKGYNDYHQILSKLKERALKDRKQWVKYYEFKQSFGVFNYAYCSTAHKSQGRTLNNVYIHEEEIMSINKLSIKEKFQALYVAITRARNITSIYNKKFRIYE